MLASLVAGFGSSSFTAFRAVSGQLDRFKEVFAKDPMVQRDVEYFKSKAATLESVDDLVNDPRLLEFALTPFGLKDKAFAKAFIKKLLVEGTDDANDLANRMSDSNHRDFAAYFEINTNGMGKFKNAAFVDDLVSKYMERRFEDEVGEGNAAVSNALYFQRKASSIESWYDVLGDEDLYAVVLTAAGMPSSFANVDIETQIAKFEEKLSLEDFKSPAKVSRMVDRYLAVSDAKSGSLGNSSAALALQTFSQPVNGFAPILTIDPTLFLFR